MNLDQLPTEKVVQLTQIHLYHASILKEEIFRRAVEVNIEKGGDAALEAYAMTVDILLHAMRKP